ncbi:hypothetical protein [Salinibacter ruber]|uniref:hypothetical protein n=1 Tax=Salinibacter ruber TaxID=146919 RepID=UPI0013C33028|nr:hypothetical protein [Salinibacter ruber]
MKQRQGTATPARSKGVSAHRSGDTLEVWGGIISAHLDDWAEELGCTPEDVLGVVESASIDPVVDTAKNKGQEDHDRPADPALRCLALTIDDAQTLKNILSQ